MNPSFALSSSNPPSFPGWRKAALLAALVCMHGALIYAVSHLTVAQPQTATATVMLVNLVEAPPAAPAPSPAEAVTRQAAAVPIPAAPRTESGKPATSVNRPSPADTPQSLTTAPAAPAQPTATLPATGAATQDNTVPVVATAKPAMTPATGPATTPATGSAQSSAEEEPPGPRLVSGVAYVREPAPEFPAASRRLGEQGTVMVKVLIDEQGHAAEVQIHRSSGFNRLDRAASRAVSLALFRPYSINGRAQAAWTIVPIHFKLEDTQEVSS